MGYKPPKIVGRAEYDEEPKELGIPFGKACCGLREFSGLSWIGKDFNGKQVDEKDVFLSAIQALWGDEHPLDHQKRALKNYPPLRDIDPLISCAHVFFTQNITSPNGYGFRFEAFLLKNKLGQVMHFGPDKNRNSGNQIITFIWAPDHAAVMEYVRKEWPV